jgi:hypothetical protein
VLRAVDLDQLAQALPAQPRLVKSTPLRARQPQPVLDHPLAQGLTRDLKPMALRELLGRQRRPEVGVALADQGQSQVAHTITQAVVRRPAARLVPKRRRAVLAKGPQQPLHLTRAQAQDLGRVRHTEAAFDDPGQHLDPSKLALAHQNPSHPPPPQP